MLLMGPISNSFYLSPHITEVGGALSYHKTQTYILVHTTQVKSPNNNSHQHKVRPLTRVLYNIKSDPNHSITIQQQDEHKHFNTNLPRSLEYSIKMRNPKMTRTVDQKTLYDVANILCSMFLSSPPKFFMQMKSICSEWRNMVSDPLFIKDHLNEATLLRNFQKRRYIHTNKAPMIQSTTISHAVEILGSCNGLILLGDGLKYCLWNPSTRALGSYKEFSSGSTYIIEGAYRNIALGYDSKNSSYKVVRIVRVASCKEEMSKMGGSGTTYYDKRNYDVTTAKVYDCKTKSRKQIENFPYVIFEDAQGVTMNGFPHWVMFKNHAQVKSLKLVIVYFDLSEEIFKEICKPHWLNPSSKYEFGVYKEQLCFIRYTELSDEVWVMPTHGECWINLSSVVDVACVRLPGWSCGHICGEPRVLSPKVFSGAMYVESLVSPLGGENMIG